MHELGIKVVGGEIVFCLYFLGNVVTMNPHALIYISFLSREKYLASLCALEIVWIIASSMLTAGEQTSWKASSLYAQQLLSLHKPQNC